MRILKLKRKNNLVRFDNKEINNIMLIYSKKISLGEWKDYSILFREKYAQFNVYKSSYQEPIFIIFKSYISSIRFSLKKNNFTIKKSNILGEILKELEKPKLKII
tara:strand:- start:16458 stop:16772 length:315 start_codon:yes stop_codon:yes gene_type:complete